MEKIVSGLAATINLSFTTILFFLPDVSNNARLIALAIIGSGYLIASSFSK